MYEVADLDGEAAQQLSCFCALPQFTYREVKPVELEIIISHITSIEAWKCSSAIGHRPYITQLMKTTYGVAEFPLVCSILAIL